LALAAAGGGEKNQSPNAFFQRVIAAGMGSTLSQVAALQGDVAAVKAGVEALLAAQRSAAAAAAAASATK